MHLFVSKAVDLIAFGTRFKRVASPPFLWESCPGQRTSTLRAGRRNSRHAAQGAVARHIQLSGWIWTPVYAPPP